MGRVGRDRQIAAGQLVLALGAGLDALELVLDGVFDGLIVAELEVQERVVLGRAPVASEQRVRAAKVDGARDEASGALGHHQHDVLRHPFADQRIELPREIGPAPFARAGLHVELEEGVPGLLGEVLAGEPVHGDTGGQRIAPLALDGFALAGR